MTVVHGDCVEAMRELDEASVDAVVCDPPYSLGFMAKPWDIAVQHEPWTREAFRVLKPGGHLLAFGGTRTYHRLACAVEDAGFEIRDTICWLYGEGFPKSLDVSKAIDKSAGVEREVTGVNPNGGRVGESKFGQVVTDGSEVLTTSPATPEAEQWQGWGTALKPAHEPIVVARKPLAGTVAQNVLEHGTGALNVDGCRIGMSDEDRERIANMGGFGKADFERRPSPTYQANQEGSLMPNVDATPHDAGRWPANVVLDEEAAGMLDEQSGQRSSGYMKPTHTDADRSVYGQNAAGGYMTMETYGDSGGASRFFYCAKASRAERNAGLDGLPAVKSADDGYGSIQEPKLDRAAPRENWEPHKTANHHPTVKPVALMRWLVRLVTPPDGLVLDPFCGSGTTGIACVLEGVDFTGIEREAEYVEIAKARIAHAQEHGEDFTTPPEPVEQIEGQLGLLDGEAA